MYDFESDYSTWRESKLSTGFSSENLVQIPIQNPSALSKLELEQLHAHCRQNNFAIYQLEQPFLADKSSIRAFSEQISMAELDQNLCADNNSITSLQVMNLGRAKGYIPYTTKALNWHTDGYYNELQQHIRSFLLHCIQNAPSGGENMLVNHELIYIALMDENPDLVTALMQPDVMTIPANIEKGKEIRPPQSGPVFYRDAQTNALQMRYTSRSRSIEWKQNSLIQRAVSRIEELLADNTFVIRYLLKPGEGLICNNILHGRSAFTNGNIPEKQRVMYRVRSYNRLFSGQNARTQ